MWCNRGLTEYEIRNKFHNNVSKKRLRNLHEIWFTLHKLGAQLVQPSRMNQEAKRLRKMSVLSWFGSISQRCTVRNQFRIEFKFLDENFVKSVQIADV